MRPRCEDCEEPVPKGKRRHRCKNCGSLVCPHCYHHIHLFAAMIANDKAKNEPTKPQKTQAT